VVDATPPPSPPPLLSDRNVEEETRGTRECEEETDAGGPESEGRERCLQYGCGGHSDERPYEHTGALKQCLCIVNYSKNTHGRKLEERLFYPSTTLEHRLKFSCITFEHHICDCPTSAKKKQHVTMTNPVQTARTLLHQRRGPEERITKDTPEISNLPFQTPLPISK